VFAITLKMSMGWSTRIKRELSMFRELIDGYRRLAKQQLEDADELESGRWRIGGRDGDESESLASNKRSLAARLLGLGRAYEEYDGK
jgi:hypothetical protein